MLVHQILCKSPVNGAKKITPSLNVCLFLCEQISNPSRMKGSIVVILLSVIWIPDYRSSNPQPFVFTHKVIHKEDFSTIFQDYPWGLSAALIHFQLVPSYQACLSVKLSSDFLLRVNRSYKTPQRAISTSRKRGPGATMMDDVCTDCSCRWFMGQQSLSLLLIIRGARCTTVSFEQGISQCQSHKRKFK